MNKRINAMYFSATGTTRRIVAETARAIAEKMDGQATVRHVDFTLPAGRKEQVSFTAEDLVIVGVPVYAGRVPNVLLGYLNSVLGNGALAVAVVVFGNRNYDDALVELQDILEARGFNVIAGAAFVGEHAFSRTLGAGRPDERDMATVADFSARVFSRLLTPGAVSGVVLKGNRPYRKYYVPRDEQGQPFGDFRKITPKTSDECIHCGLCAEVCPMGSIDADDFSRINGICIKCCACVKSCPAEAKYFDDPNYLRHKRELEIAFDRRSEPELFV